MVRRLVLREERGRLRPPSALPGLLGATVGAVLASTGIFLLALSWTGTGKGSGRATEHGSRHAGTSR